jgi:para-nitrobenzyl esterase
MSVEKGGGMSFMKKGTAGILFCILLSQLLIGCLQAGQAVIVPPAAPASAPQADIVPTTAENLGASDALSLLKDKIIGLNADSFDTPSSWTKKRQTLIDGINAAIGEVGKGAYDDALTVLASKVQDGIEKSVTGDNQTMLRQIVTVVRASIDNASKTTLNTKSGKVAGAAGYMNSWTWKGIPYAKPPINDLRWRAPADPEPWTCVRHSSDSYDVSAQREQSRMWIPTGRIVGSEDCLYLNIWRPKSDAKDLPVYFWLHGGGNSFGSGKLYDGSILASQSNLVVVSIQYRLGAMGWFNHPALKNGVTLEEKSANFGTLDTIKALQWVHENIRAFGGNPENVTVAGESAGCHNTLNLIVSPLGTGLFNRAICESGGLKLLTVEAGIAQANSTIDKLLVADGTARSSDEAVRYREKMTAKEIERYLRGKTAAELITVQIAERMKAGFHPAFIDGNVIPDTWLNTIASGKYNHVPIIIGSNEYELKPFEPLLGAAIPTSNGRKWSDLYKVLGGQLKLDDVLAGQFDKDLYEACGYYGTRYWKANNVDSIARQLKQQQDNVWAYLFKWGGVGSGPSPYDFIIGAGHATEIPFFFGWPRDTFGYAFTEQNRQGRQGLQKAVMFYAAEFAATGDPNAPDSTLPRWETWSNTAGGPKCIVFDGAFTEVKIDMMTEEVTAESVRAEVETLPALIKPVVKLWIQ